MLLQGNNYAIAKWLGCLPEYSRQKNLTFLPPWNLTDVTVKKFTRGKNLTFLPPWGDKRGAFKALLSALLTTANPQDGMKLPLHPRCCP